MTNITEASGPSDAALRALWQASGGTFYAANREVGSMPVARLLPFLRGRASSLPAPVAIVDKLSDRAMAELRDQIRAELRAEFAAQDEDEAPPASAAPASGVASAYASALMALVGAVCPGLDSGNLLHDAEIATAAMAGAEPAAFFVLDEEPAADGGPRYLQVQREHAADDDIDAFPLYQRVPMKAEVAAPGAPAKSKGGRGGRAREGGAS